MIATAHAAPGGAAQRAGEILQQLIDLTPEPGPDIDPEHLLVAFEVIVARRAEVLAQIVPPLRLTDADRALVGELERRQGLWQQALAAALSVVGGQRHGNTQLRAYGRAP
jgi:hypothetical protein